MNKIKLLSFLVVALVILNITILVVFIFNKPNHPEHPRLHQEPKNIIIERLHFDDTQITAYEELIKTHKTNIKTRFKELRNAKEELYILLNDNDSTKKDALISKINNTQKEIEQLHFNHFLDIKKLCKDDQLIDYEELTHELARLFAPHPKPRR